MPLVPTVFNSIRSDDYQTRVVKAYKQYTVTNVTFSGSGYRAHNGIWKLHPPDINDPSVIYPNNYDNANQHVVWKSIDHRYYRDPYNIANCHEGTDVNKTEKYYFISASVLSIPYLDVGQQIKAGTLSLRNSAKSITLQDDSNGNLRDTSISTASFASASRCFFYMSFNNEFRQFEYGTGTITSGSVEYRLGKNTYRATARNVDIVGGVTTTGTERTSGLAASFNTDGNGNSGIRIPHDARFNNFNSCDRWTISLWIYDDNKEAVLLSKGPVKSNVLIRDNATKMLKREERIATWPDPIGSSGEYTNYRTPFILFNNGSNGLRFLCSNGSTYSAISGTTNGGEWNHIVIRRDNTNLSLFINGTSAGTTTMPADSTANDADIEIGCFGGFDNTYVCQVDEIRFYDYALSNTSITSLAGRSYTSTTLYQTNVAGNVFYRNGQIVVSSPMPIYNGNGAGFVASNGNWTCTYRGTHQIYENEVLVRVPAGQFNYTMNPTATYRPGTAGSANDCNTSIAGAQSNNPPGDVYLDMFVSGTVGPYITTIGLYNDQAQLIAVGKLAHPVTKLSDVDMNFIIRWDY